MTDNLLPSGPRPRFSACPTGGCLVLALLLAWADPAQAAPLAGDGQAAAAASAPTPLLVAFDVSSYFSGVSSRSNVVRVCVAVMALALFIMMKKFNGAERQ